MMGDDVEFGQEYSIELQAFSIAEVFHISPMEVMRWNYDMFLLALEWLHHRKYAQKNGGGMNGRPEIESYYRGE